MDLYLKSPIIFAYTKLIQIQNTFGDKSNMKNNTRENWTSKLGVMLAVAGSAVGLGNFLRFPVKAASYGGGAFLIPYFIAFVLLGIPMIWIEWTLGRYGGKFSHGSGPGILNAIVRKKWAKYLGSLGIFGPLLIFFFYVYIESWLLGFCWYSLNGQLMQAATDNSLTTFFGQFINHELKLFGDISAALIFFCVTYVLNFIIIFYGIRSGIEKVSKIAMPTIVILGLILLVRVLTLPNIQSGLAFMWNPDYSYLKNPKVWLEASGQVFFTLSVGIGVILTYASYVRKNQDIALSSLAAAGTNEFLEIIIGGTIVIPTAFVIYGATQIVDVANQGTVGLGFMTMPMIFSQMPFGGFFQFTWFALLFIAGITSSVSIIQPAISFLEDELDLKRKASVLTTAVFSLLFSFIVVFGLNAGALDEMDFWGGTFCIVLLGTIEAVIAAWIFGVDNLWKELTAGAEIKIPAFFKFIIKYVTPTYLIAILAAWIYTDGWNVITLKNIDPTAMVDFLGFHLSKVSFITIMRLLLLALLGVINLIIFITWRLKKIDEKLENNEG